MWKNYVKIFLAKLVLITVFFNSGLPSTYAQCDNCTVTGPTIGTVTVPAGEVMCFTSNATLEKLIIGDNSTVCIASGVTVTVSTGIFTTAGNNIKLDVYGTLTSNQPPTFNASVDLTVYQGATITIGGSGWNSDLYFNGTDNNIYNFGTINCNVLTYGTATSTSIVENHCLLNVKGNMNLAGKISFLNANYISVGASFNNNPDGIYINCGTIETETSFNLQGGAIVNTGYMYSANGAIDVPAGSDIDNYGDIKVQGINLNGGSIYNEGLVTLSGYIQGGGATIAGPSDNSKLGYIVVGSAGPLSQSTIGPNLNFKNSNVTGRATVVTDVFTSSITQLSGVTFDCEASGNCAAPMVNSGYPCPLLNPQLTKTVDLTYDADGNGLVTVGDELTYTITLVNGGLISATGVSISDNLQGLSALTCFPASGATLRPAETMTCTATYTVTSDDESRGYVENQSVMIYNEGPDVLSDDPNTPELNDPTVIFVEKVEESTPISDSDDSPSGRFTVKKSADKNLVPAEGANVNYTYEVTNNTDRELYYISGSDNKCNINLQGGIYRRNVWGIGSYVYYLPAGKTATWTCSSYITQTTTNTATFTFANSYSVDLFGVVRYSGSESASASLTVRRQLPTGINDCNTLLFSSDEKGNSFPNGIVGLLNADGSTTTVFDIQAQTNSSGLEGTATMAMDPSDPSKIYYIPRDDLSEYVDHFGGLYVYNAAIGSSTELSPANSTPDVVRLGIDPHGLIWTVDSDGKAWSFNTGTNTWTDRGTISLPSGYSWNNLKSGDLTFDGNGIMYLVASDNTNYVGQLFTLTQQELLDGSPAATFVGTMGSNQYNGISFTENGDLYASSASDAGSVLYTIDIATGEASTYKTLNNYYITDLGSCALPKPEISVTKVASPTSFVSQGDEITYTINVCNRGTLPASGSYLTDQLPANVTYVAGSTTLNGTNVADINGASPLATKMLVNSSASGAGRIAPGECAVVTFKVKVNIVCGSICNSASFNYTGVASPIISDDPRQPGGQDQTCNTVQPEPLDLSPATQNICSGQNMTPITIAGDLGGIVTWSSDVLGLSGSGRTIDAGSFINNGTDPYTVTIMVESELPGGCSSINSATITVLPEPQLTIDHSYISVCDYEPVNINATPVPSGNNTGVFTTTAPAGLTDNGNGTATLDVSAAGAGTFEVTYTYTDIDGNACVNSETVTVKVFDSPVGSVSSVKNVLCKGESTGSAVFTITGETSSYNLSGDIVATDVTSPYTATGLSAGTYQVTLTDANNCSATASVTITEPATALVASVTSGTLSCNAGTTSLIVSASGGTPDYEYSLDNITYQSSNEFTVSFGSYVVYVKDANGCMFTVPSYTVPYACLTATKTAAESSYSAVNDEINYTITVSNSGNVTIDNVVVTDKNADAAPTYVSGDTNDNGIMEVGEIWTYSATHTVTQADLDAGHVDNVASATGEDTSDNPVSDDSDEVTIDAIQTIIINDVSVVEGNDLVFTISLTGISTTDVTFVPVLADGTAIIGADTKTPVQYSTDGGNLWTIWTAGDPLTIIAGETEVLFKVPSVDDNIDEVDEDFEVAVGVTNGNTLNTSVTAIGTIEDDDTAAVASITDATAEEGSDLTHTVTMSTASATDEVYAFSVTDVTATKDVDYTGTPVFSDGVYDNGDGTITVPAGVTEFTVTFPGLPDDLDENDETYTLSIGGEEATGTIEDDDTAAVASVTAATATEGDDLTHTVTMSTASATDEVYAFIVTDVTATMDVDYTGTPVFSNGVYDNGDGTITVPAGVTEFTVTFPGLPDDLDENDETYTLSIGGEEATGTIEDDDTAAVASVTAATATEGDDLTHTVTMSTASATDEVYAFIVTDVTATMDVDYTGTPVFSNGVYDNGDGTITVPTGVTEFTVTFPGLPDDLDENDETYTLSIGGEEATGTIEDDDTAAVASVTAATATEGDDLTHTVTMSTASATDEVYAFIVTDVTATKDVDYTGTPVFSNGVYDNGDGTITVPAGVTEFTVTFPGLPDDLDENDETYTLSIGGEEATGTIEDDDTAAVASVTAATATEGDHLTHTVTMSTASATDEVYAFSVTDVTATMDVDYTGTPVFSDGVYDNGYGTITVPAGVTEFTVTFPGLPDDLDENDETYTLSIDGEEATGTIEDDDTAAVASITAATATEGDDLTHTVTMSTASATDEVYAFIVTDVTATKDVDYTGTPVFSDGVYDNGYGTITVPAGVTEFTVTFPGLPDDLDENDETYTLSIDGEEATGTIEDDDTAAVASITAATATEGTNLTHTVTMTNESATDELYAFSVTDVTATAGLDYTGTPVFSNGVYDNGDGTITVPAGITEFTVTFPGLPDDLDENDETYTLSIGGEEATGTITDDNASSLTISKTQIAGPSSVNTVGQIITYSIIVTNTGDAIITGIVPTETYPGSGAGTLSAATESISTNGVLDVGETWTYTATYTTTQADVDAALPLVNMISVVTTEVPGPTTDTETTSVSQSPNITVTKSATESSYSKVGDVLNYTITVSNSGNVTIDNVVVSDTKADAGSLSYVSGDDGDNLLQVGEEWIYSAIHTVTQSDLDAGSFVNVASVTGDDPEDNPVSDDTPPVTVPSDQSTNITVTKSATESSYSKVGDILNYTITVSNSGNVTIDNVVVSDTKADAGSLSYVSGDDGDNLLQVGEEWIYSAIHTVTQSDLDAGSFVNVASVTGDDPEDNPVSDDTPPVTVPSDQSPNITVTKSATESNYSKVGDILNYTITVSNSGNVTIDNVVVSDTKADAGSLSYVSGDDGDNLLQVGEEWIYSAIHTVTQSDLDAGSFVNVASVTGDDPEDNPVSDDTPPVTVPSDQSPNITVTKSATESSYSKVGDVLNYTITVSNSGNVTIDNVVVSDTKADAGSLSYVSGDDGDNLLQVGEEWIYSAIHTVTQSDLDVGSFVNVASVTGDDPEDNPVSDDTPPVTVPSDQSPNITVTKSATESSYSKVGDVLNYTITVSNSGNVTIDNVVVSDTKADAGSLSYVSGDDGDNLLQVGEEWIYSAIHTVTQSDLDAGSFVNVASVTGDDPEDNPVSDDTPPVTVPSDQSTNITVTKSATESSYSKVGDVLNYTITVSNSGNVTIDNVVVSDTKADAGSLSYVSGDDGDNLLQVGEEWIYSAIHTVTQSDLDAGSFVNVASVTGDDPEDNLVSDDTPPVTVIYNGVANSTYAQNDFNNTYINTSVSGNVLTNDEDFEGDNITVTTPHVISDLGVEVSIDPLTGGYLYIPLTGYVGSDKFEYTICDDGDNQACDAAVVYISILPSGIECNNCEGRITSLTLRYEGETETAVKVIQQKGDNAFEQSVAPEEEFEFYGTEDATLGTEISIYTDDMLNATIHTSCSQPIGAGMKFGDFVIVEGYSKEGGPLGPGECDVYPVANLDNAFTLKDEGVSGNLTENDFDPDGDVVSINTTPVELPDNGTVIINSDGTYIYTPDSGFIGEDFFVYEICDLDNLCSNAIVNITVLPVSTNITQADDDAYNGEVNSLINGNVLANDFDNEDDSQYVTSTVAVSDQGVTVSIDPVTGEFSYIPLTDYVGSDRFIYSVCDDGNPQACDDATVYLIVGGAVYVNTTYAVNDTIETIAGVEVSGNVMDNDYDLEGDNQKVSTITVISSEGVEVRINPGNGDFSYIPPEGFGGIDTFRYTVCDDNISSACDEATVLIIVYLDSDNDGVADNIDVDDDNDGILDIREVDLTTGEDIDSDGDGIVDRLDIDADNDGIVDNVEWQSTIAEGGEYDYIFPLGTDSNGDGWDDAYDPASNGITYEPWDMDLDGTPDYLDTNTDNEGEDDNVEGWDEFPNDSIADVSYIGSDADKDGLDDAYDTYNTTTEEWAPRQNAIGSDAYLQDTDDDGVRDWRDAVDDRTPPEQFACGDPVIPNAFSPNQDGYNDYFKIMIYCTGTQGGNEERVLGDDFTDARIEIFNRWGNLVYEQERYGDEDYWGDVDAWWDGTSMNNMQVGGNQLPTATYYYILYFNDGKREPITGFVFLNN